MFLPLTYSSPAFAITQAEYDALVAQAQADVASAQSELETQQAELDALNASKSSLEQSLSTSQQVLNQAQSNLNRAKEENDEQSILVRSALAALDSAQLNVENKQAEIVSISNSIISQSSEVTQKVLELQTETIKLNNLAQDIIDSQEELNNAKASKQEASQVLDLATVAYNAAVINYNASVSDVHTKGSVVDSKSIQYNQSLSNLDSKMQALLSAQNDVDVAQYNYNNNLIAVYPENSEPTVYGLQAKIYSGVTPAYPERSETAYTYCKTITVTEIAKNWGGGSIEGCGGDYILIHYTGYLTVPTTMNYEFLANVDDGWYMTLDGMVINDNWTLKGCGGWWSSPVQLEAGHPYAIDAWMYEHGGGACNYLYYYTDYGWGLVPPEWLSQNAPSQPTYENDPALLTALQNKQSLLAIAQAEYSLATIDSSTANSEYLFAIDQYSAAISNWQTKQTEMTNAEQIQLGASQQVISSDVLIDNIEQSLQEAQVSYAQQQLLVAQKQSTLTSEDFALQLLQDSLTQAQNDVLNNINIVNDLQDALNAQVQAKNIAEADVATQTLLVTQAEEEVESITVMAQSISQKTIAQQEIVVSASSLLTRAIKQLAEIPLPEVPVIEPEPTTEPTVNPVPEPNPEPEPEPIGEPNIPEVIENLLEINLEAVNPAELTETQVEQLKEAAYETFETAEEGSPEYEQALEALFVAAEANDIELSEELAAIPGLTAAVDAINFIGNVGADMSPKVREESEKIVVTAVVAVGAAVNAATGAALSAAAPSAAASVSAGGSGGTSSTRRKD